MQNHPTTRSLLAFLVILVSAFFSFYFYCSLPDQGGVVFPGIIYTSATILVFLIMGVDLKIGRLAVYFVLMLVTYVAIYIITWASTYLSAVVGIFTAGLAAYITLLLVKKFISQIRFAWLPAVLCGAFAFGLTDICAFSFEQNIGQYFFNVEDDIDVLYAEIFVFWQLFVGGFLIVALRRKLSEPVAFTPVVPASFQNNVR